MCSSDSTYRETISLPLPQVSSSHRQESRRCWRQGGQGDTAHLLAPPRPSLQSSSNELPAPATSPPTCSPMPAQYSPLLPHQHSPPPPSQPPSAEHSQPTSSPSSNPPPPPTLRGNIPPYVSMMILVLQQDPSCCLSLLISRSLLSSSLTVDWGEPFVKATYFLEGDGPLALECYEAIQKFFETLPYSECASSSTTTLVHH